MSTVFTIVAVLAQLANSGFVPPKINAQIAQATGMVSASNLSELQAEAENGDARAQFQLGQVFDKGIGAPQDDVSAAKWYRKAADQGDAAAQTSLGLMYREGRGVEKSKQQAVEWYRKAARQGNASAMFNLGVAYYNGDGVGENSVSAYVWFLLAKTAGSPPATDAVKRSEAEMRPGGIRDGLLLIATMYEKGEDVNANPSEAAKWYRKAAERGIPQAQLKLAEIFADGRGVPQDYAEARSWCEAADRLQYRPAGYCLGRIYQQGLGVAKDGNAARGWYEKAAQGGDSYAMEQLGQMYLKGDGVRLDKVAAESWLLLANSCRNPKAGDEAIMVQKEMTDKEIQNAKDKALSFIKSWPFACRWVLGAKTP